MTGTQPTFTTSHQLKLDGLQLCELLGVTVPERCISVEIFADTKGARMTFTQGLPDDLLGQWAMSLPKYEHRDPSMK